MTADEANHSNQAMALFNPNSSSDSGNLSEKQKDGGLEKARCTNLVDNIQPLAFPERRIQSNSSAETADLIKQHFTTPASACGAMLVGFKGQAIVKATAIATAAIATAALESEITKPMLLVSRDFHPPIEESQSVEMGHEDAGSSTTDGGSAQGTVAQNEVNSTGGSLSAANLRLVCDRYGFIIGESKSESLKCGESQILQAARNNSIASGKKRFKIKFPRKKKKKNSASKSESPASKAANHSDGPNNQRSLSTADAESFTPSMLGFSPHQGCTEEATNMTSLSNTSRHESLRTRQRRGADISNEEAMRRMKKEQKRLAKWQTLVKHWDSHFKKETKKCSPILHQRIRKGIPHDIRGKVWPLLANVPIKIRENPNTYKDLVWSTEIPSQEIRDTIERDIHRTFPRHALFFQNDEDQVNASGNGRATEFKAARVSNNKGKFSLMVTTEQLDEYATKMFACGNDDAVIKEEIIKQKDRANVMTTDVNGIKFAERELLLAKGGQASLRRVLRAYSLYDADVGYCQGMNFIAASFITLMSEEEAFWLLVAIMNEKPTQFRGLFGERMDQTQQILYTSEKLIAEILPALHTHFEKENIHITMFATQWLLTIYTSSFPFDLVLRVWDIFIAEGYKIVYRVMLALLKDSSEALMKMQFEEILAYLPTLPSIIDGKEIMKIALSINLSKKQIEKYDKEWQERVKSR